MKEQQIIGRAEPVVFPEIGLSTMHARIDTGAKTSSIWVSSVTEKDNTISVVFLGDRHDLHTGDIHVFDNYEKRVVMSSNGHAQERYVVRLLVLIAGRKIRANFTLADRSTQVYPVLIGRNVLRGKFVVDVKLGDALVQEERKNSDKIQAGIVTKMKAGLV